MSEFQTFIEFIDLPHLWWLPVALLALLLLGLMAWQLRGLLLSRTVAVMAFALLFATPYITQITLAPVDPVALIIVDQSASMQLEKRPEQTRSMLEHLQQELQKNENLQVDRYDIAAADAVDTRIFTELMPIIQKYDPARIAAVFLITDGQVADSMPESWPTNGPPLHVLLAGAPGQQQAYLEILAPQLYALTKSDITVRLRANWETAHSHHDNTILSITNDDRHWQQKIPLNNWVSVSLPITHKGNNRFIFSLPTFKDMAFPAVQTAVVDVNGIQNNTKILWQSKDEIPTWLDPLRTDPLVSLETVPADSTKFEGYDLVILDEPFSQSWKAEWIEELIAYIRGGGNILLIQSSVPIGDISPQLKEILPVQWQENDNTQSQITATLAGSSHPITADLLQQFNSTQASSGALPNSYSDAKFLLETADHHVLLAISNIKSGRIAALTGNLLQQGASDGLLRNLILWLLRDPDFSDHAITAHDVSGEIRIEYLGDDPVIQSLLITRPDRSMFELALQQQGPGISTTAFTPDQMGTYVISDGKSETVFVHGNVMIPEFQMAAATAIKLNAMVQKTGGQILWMTKSPAPELRWVTLRQNGGENWLALRAPRAAVSTGAVTYPLLPKFLLFLLITAALSYGWWRESQ